MAAASASDGAAIGVKLVATYSLAVEGVAVLQAVRKADDAPSGNNGALARNLRVWRRDGCGRSDMAISRVVELRCAGGRKLNPCQLYPHIRIGLK